MSQTLQTLQLKTVNDYKYLAYALGDKLRNPNFQPNNRESFIKSLLQQIRPACSLKAYQRIQKSINQISHQKDLDIKQQKAKLELESNKKQKKLVAAKESGRVDAFGRDLENYDEDIDDYGSSEEEDDDFEDKQNKYKPV